MTAPRPFDDRLDAFLEEGQNDLPDRAFDAVRHDIHLTRQRVVIGPWREPSMSTLSRLAMAAAIVAAVALAWANWPGKGDVGPLPSPSITPTPVTFVNAGIVPLTLGGRYRIENSKVPGGEGLLGPTVDFTIPAVGWTSYETFAADRNYGVLAGPSFLVWNITNVYVDPCTDHTPRAPVPGPGIDELLAALVNQVGLEAGPITAVTVDGYNGKFVELTATTDKATCVEGDFYPFVDKWIQDNEERERVYALDVDGTRFTFFARIPQRTLSEHLAELEKIIASVDIQP